MPRYRFAWENLPRPLIKALGRELELGRDAPARLRSMYGARPGEDFVRDCWPMLRDVWLNRDPIPRKAIVDALQELDLGNSDAIVRSAAQQKEYLASCRNGSGLRAAVLGVFIELGEVSATVNDDPVIDSATSTRPDQWQGFGVALSQVLECLETDQYLILSARSGQRFVQFAAQGEDGLRAETVSNAYLEPDERLTEIEESTLRGLGWSPPTHSPESDDKHRDGSPNWYREWPVPVPFHAVGGFVMDTFGQALGIVHPQWLQYKAFAKGGEPLLLPTLGLRRELDEEPEERGPSSSSDLQRLVRDAVRDAGKNETLDFDADGDLPCQLGSTVVYVRVIDATPVIRVFSIVLREVPQSYGVLQSLNELNQGHSSMKWLHVDNMVIAATEFLALPFTADHLIGVVSELGGIVDQVDEQLQDQFGGRLPFGDFKPAPIVGAGGYI